MDGDELDAILGTPRASGGDPILYTTRQTKPKYSPRKRG